MADTRKKFTQAELKELKGLLEPLPDDILLQLFSHMSWRTIVSFMLTNSYVLNFVNSNESIWENLFRCYFSFFLPAVSSVARPNMWRESFREYYGEKGELVRLTKLQKTIVMHIMESDVEALDKIKISYEEFLGFHTFLAPYGNQAVRDHFFEKVVLPFFNKDQTKKLGAVVCERTCRNIIHYVAFFNQLQVQIEPFIEQGADIDLVECIGVGATPLRFAAERNFLNMVKKLVESNASMDVGDVQKLTPLAIAIDSNHSDVMNYLIDQGARLILAGSPHITAPIFAASRKNVKLAEYMIMHPKVGFKNNITPKTLAPLLTEACRIGDFEMMNWLIEKGADIKIVDGTHNYRVHLAIGRNHFKMVEYLIRQGLDVNSRDADNNTPLHQASVHGHLAIVKYLIENGADVNAMGEGECTPLHFAAHQNHLEVVKYLVENRADLRAVSAQGNMPLHFACERNHLEIVKYFIETAGLSVDLKNGNDCSPLFISASFWDHVDLVNYLIEKNAAINLKNVAGFTALHAASRDARSFAIVKNLVEHGANVNAMDDHDDLVPLHLAAERNCPEILSYLIEKGANMEVKNKKGLTPLVIAVLDNNLDNVKRLVENGSNVNVDIGCHVTVLFGAALLGCVEIVNCLRQKNAIIKQIDYTERRFEVYETIILKLTKEKNIRRCFEFSDLSEENKNLPHLVINVSIISALEWICMLLEEPEKSIVRDLHNYIREHVDESCSDSFNAWKVLNNAKWEMIRSSHSSGLPSTVGVFGSQQQESNTPVETDLVWAINYSMENSKKYGVQPALEDEPSVSKNRPG